MALDRTIKKLHESQNDTTKEVSLLRSQFKELAIEMRSDRLKFIELMREMQSQPSTETDTTAEETNGSDARSDRKEGNSSLKAILIGVLALGTAFALFNKELNGLPGLFAKSIGDTLKNLFTGPPGDSDPATVPTSVSTTGVTASKLIGARMQRNIAAKSAAIDADVDAKTAQKVEQKQQRLQTKARATALSNITPDQTTQLQRFGMSVKDGQLYDKKDRLLEGEKADAALKKAGVTVDVPQVSATASKATNVKAAVDKVVRKQGYKVAAKSIPFLGAIAGVGFSIERAIKGDYVGAVLDLGAAGMSGTGLGAVGGAALSVTAIARDAYAAAYPDETLEQSMIDDPEGTQVKFGNILEMVKASLAEMATQEKAPARTSAANARRAQRGQAPVGTFTSQSVATAETVNPVSGSSVTQQASAIVEKQTQESVASAATPQTVVFNDQSNNSKTAVSSGGGAGVQQMTFNSTARSAHNLDAYAFPV